MAAVVSLALYTVFNVLIRTRASDNDLAVTRMLLADGGYALTLGLGRKLGSRPVDEASKRQSVPLHMAYKIWMLQLGAGHTRTGQDSRGMRSIPEGR